MSEDTTVTDEMPALTEQLAADAAAEVVEFPDGAPELVSILALSRRRRADYYDVTARVMELQKQLPKVTKKKTTTQDQLGLMSGYVRMVAEIEDLLAIVAKDETEFRAWAASTDDASVVQLWRAWQEASQPGEADSSSN